MIVTEPLVKPAEVALIVNVLEILSGLTTHKHLPLNAFLKLLLKLELTSAASPLSVPITVPFSTVNVTSFEASGHNIPYLSTTSHSINTRSSLFLLTTDLSAFNTNLYSLSAV